MFTGIITDVGSVRSVIKTGDWRFEFNTAYETAKIDLGASIACSGCCLTVVDRGPGWFAAEVSAETMSKTICSTWEAGSLVNFERPLKAGDELGGHIVSGHVDGVGTITLIEPEGDSLRFQFKAPEELSPFIASKGSIAVNGVSLTVNEVSDAIFGVNIIPHTRENTTFRSFQVGALVNLEIDLLARYVARLLEKE
ncbi:MAG: riboflavin synthase [Rhodospirillaceae bacterium]|nr:riboflavin synthase [Rhodospirillaceae bacterium]